jgi:hypothetical protein
MTSLRLPDLQRIGVAALLALWLPSEGCGRGATAHLALPAVQQIASISAELHNEKTTSRFRRCDISDTEHYRALLGFLTPAAERPDLRRMAMAGLECITLKVARVDGRNDVVVIYFVGKNNMIFTVKGVVFQRISKPGENAYFGCVEIERQIMSWCKLPTAVNQ